ncbi:MAG: mechanosensitive ion channel family protein [Saprospiraceae bacterium]
MKESLIHFGTFIAIIIATIIVAYLVNRFFRRQIQRSTFEMKTDPTNYLFLRHAISALVYITGFSIAIYSMPNLRALASSLLAGAGILAVSVGFASQHALSNIISGAFIVMFKPFRINNRLTLRGLSGIVEDITLRHTVIRDFENKRIIIPNAVISDEVIINADFADGRICKYIDVGISFDSDIDLAKKIMTEEVLKHPLHVDPRNPEQIQSGTPEVVTRVLGFGESAVNMRTWAWAKDSPDGFILSCDLFESIKKRFDREGVEIPFPHRTIIQKDNPNA